MPKPPKISSARRLAMRAASLPAMRTSPAASRETSVAAALSTSAQAVPSGYFSSRCWSTISVRRSGIIIRMPSRPPSTPTSSTREISRSKPRIRIAGIVTPRPKASDSPAEPAVCAMLFSRIVDSRAPSCFATPNSVMAMTATGIEALTVRPTFSTRYSDDAPKIMPRMTPMIRARGVISANWACAGIYGLKLESGGMVSLVAGVARRCGRTESRNIAHARMERKRRLKADYNRSILAHHVAGSNVLQ